MLLLGPFGGVLADRFDRRRTYLVTQLIDAALAVALGVLVVTDVVTVWMVAILALAFGCTAAIDQPRPTGVSARHRGAGAAAVRRSL